MQFQTFNPASGEVLNNYEHMSDDAMMQAIQQSDCAYQQWRLRSFQERAVLMKKLAGLLRENVSYHARVITTEMGKPISQAKAEIMKCAWICDHYAEHAEHYLAPRIVKTEMSKSMVCYEPLGAIFAIMPWNYPYWQVLRFAAPNIMAGNVGVLSHAPNSTAAALEIAKLFLQAGFPEGVFTSLLISIDQAAKVIADPKIVAVTLTGSARAGRAVGTEAAAHLKKVVLELGGSDPYVILKDADLESAAICCVQARLSNAGQICISPKRIIAVPEIYDHFKDKLKAEITKYVPGDPLQDTCNFGPMAREDLRDELHKQVQASIKAGAVCETGGKFLDRAGYYYAPTFLTEVAPGMPAYHEELFGPVVCLLRAKDEADAIRIANDSPFGLGAAIFTNDLARGEAIARSDLHAGICAVNTSVGSDPRTPFGGIKQSGYGRECAQEGICEFTNIKTVNIK